MSTKPISQERKEFFQDVYEVVRLIPEGKVSSYGAIARYLGSASGARMVGWAMNSSFNQKEPVPAHRVVNRLGMLTGKHHFETPTLMEKLLEAEGVQIIDDRVVKFKELRWQPLEEL